MAMNEGFDLLSRSVAVTSTPVVKTRSNWATVETIDPLTIILDEDTTNTPREVSENAVGRLKINDRVRFAHEDKRLVITEAPSKVDDLFSLRIPAGANLNDYVIPGQYYNPENVEVATFSNKPSSTAGALVVLNASTSPGSGVGVIQYWHEYDTDLNANVFRRRLYSGSWSSWDLWVGVDGWVDMALNAGFTGTARVRRVGATLVELEVSLSAGTFGEGNLAYGSVPAGYRPTGTDARLGAYFTGGYHGLGYVSPGGTAGITQRSGAARTNPSIRGMWSLY